MTKVAASTESLKNVDLPLPPTLLTLYTGHVT